MDYSYVAYTKDRKLVNGKISAENEQAAAGVLNRGGFQVVQLKASVPFLSLGKLNLNLTPSISMREVVFFSRQLALLIESGIDIDRALELLSSQMSNRAFKSVIGEVMANIREGGTLSTALSKHPKVFPQMYHRAIAAGEQGGNLVPVLRRMAEFMERSSEATRKMKSAMTYPAVILVVAVVVIAVLVTFVLPTFTQLFTAFGGELPFMAKILLAITDWTTKYGLYVIGMIVVAAIAAILYIRTEPGAYLWDKISLRLPILGRINLLNQLSYICRIMALLFKVGLSPPDIINLTITGTNNRAVIEALKGVVEELVRGEGLSRPMSRRSVFLPLMVQMIAVGEESGNLDQDLETVAQSYESESDERTRAAIGMIQPVMTIFLAGMVAFIAFTMVQTMFGVYGQIGG